MKDQRKKFIIVTSGNSEEDIESVFEEAVRRIREGNNCGHDSNDSGAFYFETSESYPDSELPS